MKSPNLGRQPKRIAALLSLGCLAAFSTQANAGSLNLDNIPLVAGANTQPIVMLDITKDHQLHYKAYNDFTDLDGDGKVDPIETTYWHANNYYGYFDPVKCYSYDTVQQMFIPQGVSPGNNKYCNTITFGGVGTWSGNFLNWVTMTRMDLVRKLLYGGRRSTDTAASTVLERDLLPQDAHAWAKYYAGADIASLTPYNPPLTPPSAAATGSNAPSGSSAPYSYSGNPRVKIGGSSTLVPGNFTTRYLYYFRNITPSISVCRGDQVRVNFGAANSPNYMVGVVYATDGADCSGNGPSTGFTLMVDHTTGLAGGAQSNANNAWTVTDLTDTGISFCNVTNGASSGANSLSQTNTNPPLLRIAQGNFAIWGANDVFICQWNPGGGSRPIDRSGGNGNIASLSAGPGSNTTPAGSLNWASSVDPIQSVFGMGYPIGAPTTFDLVVRVQACTSFALIGTERCKVYGSSLKPIGLLQTYGDPGVDQIFFGLMTGSYAKNKSGGVLRKNAGTFTDEINASNGTFLRPATGSIVDTLDKLRLYGYQWVQPVGPGTYANDGCRIVNANDGDTTLNRSDFTEGNCTSWGNPMSEVYLESLRYLAGKSANPAFTYSGSTQDSTLGLPLANWKDPLTTNNYCASLNALVFNAATASWDNDQLSGISDLNTALTAQQWTNIVGDSLHENINGGTWFIGNSGTLNNGICSPKTLTNFGSAFGICPEQPGRYGTYLMDGIAYEAHTTRIRTDAVAAKVPASDTNSLKVNTYGISLQPNTPKITIPVGSNTVTILPAGMFEDKIVTFGRGEIVDFKMLNLTPTSGTYFVEWDESEQGADYELDVWGTISYVVNNATNKITVTTKVAGRGSGNGCIGFGYVISGTTQDGVHFHSGVQDPGGTANGCMNSTTTTPSKKGFYYQYTPPSGPAITECNGCSVNDASSSKIYIATGGGATTLQDPLWYAAKYGGFHDLNGNGRPDLTAEWDTLINATGATGSDGIPDNYFPVTNANFLETALDRSLTLILGNSSASSVATNSTSLSTATRIFQARFNTVDWSGQFQSFPIDLNGIISTTQDWDSGQQINTQTPASRVIISYNPASGVAHNNSGIPFEWSNVSANATLAAYLNQNANGVADALGPQRVSYLRGDASLEGASANTFRRRPASKLGDIIDSNPQYVGAPIANYADPSYQSFASTFASRNPVLYVGANDGLLHGFNAIQNKAAGGGKEVLGYVPSWIYSDLPKLMSQNYVHRYFVDGTPNVQDVCMTLSVGGVCPAAANWKTVLVGGLRAGGKSVFALDVTDPTQFTEANANKLALWEFNDSDDPDLGFVYGQPQIGRMANGKWAVVFGNGYNNTYKCISRPCPLMGGAEGPLDSNASSTGHGVLYILFIQDGAAGSTWTAGSFIKLDTMAGTVGNPNGLAQPLLVTDSNGNVSFIYVGDLQGNMWKFDVTNTTPSNWATAFGSVPSPQPLFTAKDASSNPQPITSAPVVISNPQGGQMVLFGTGQYIQSTDPSNLSQQTIYGIWDNGSPVNGRNKLVAQTVLANVTTSAGMFRVTSQNAVNYGGSPAPTGWFMDFPNVDASGNPVYGSGTATGERVADNLIIGSAKATITSLIPSVVLCSSGGTSFIMDLDPLSGGRLTFSPFDANGNNNFTGNELVNVPGLGLVTVSGIQSTVGIAAKPTVISGAAGSGKEYKVLSGSTGGLASVLENPGPPPPPGGPFKRRSWREIFRQ